MSNEPGIYRPKMKQICAGPLAPKQKRRPPEREGGVLRLRRIVKRSSLVLGRPGSDLLSQGLSHSTIGAEEFNGRVRDGIGFKLLARTTRPAKDKDTKQAGSRCDRDRDAIGIAMRSSAAFGLGPRASHRERATSLSRWIVGSFDAKMRFALLPDNDTKS